MIRKELSIYDTEQQLNTILKIKQFVASAPKLLTALESAKSDILVNAREIFKLGQENEILELISTYINENAIYAKTALELRNQRTHAVKVCTEGSRLCDSYSARF